MKIVRILYALTLIVATGAIAQEKPPATQPPPMTPAQCQGAYTTALSDLNTCLKGVFDPVNKVGWHTQDEFEQKEGALRKQLQDLIDKYGPEPNQLNDPVQRKLNEIHGELWSENRLALLYYFGAFEQCLKTADDILKPLRKNCSGAFGDGKNRGLFCSAFNAEVTMCKANCRDSYDGFDPIDIPPTCNHCNAMALQAYTECAAASAHIVRLAPASMCAKERAITQDCIADCSAPANKSNYAECRKSCETMGAMLVENCQLIAFGSSTASPGVPGPQPSLIPPAKKDVSTSASPGVRESRDRDTGARAIDRSESGSARVRSETTNDAVTRQRGGDEGSIRSRGDTVFQRRDTGNSMNDRIR